MKTIQGKLMRAAAAGALMPYALAQAVSAAYLTVINGFICSLIGSFQIMGNSIAIIMFVYGGIKYIYTADDPGGRKQAMGICVAAIIAMIIIQAARGVIGEIGQIIITTAGFAAGSVADPCP
ncbi:MAG: hypothetical protein V1875_02620 [Candidatus Altiarchaeota archaeon]